MSGILEISIAVSAILGVATACGVKIIHQIQNSRCTSIKCCMGCIDCDRNIEIEIPEVETTAPTAATTASRPINIPNRPTIHQLRSRYE